jgi:molecular chaperone GrpE
LQDEATGERPERAEGDSEDLKQEEVGLGSEETLRLEADLRKAQKLMEDERKRGEDYLSRLRYLQADFENYRKRVDREIRDIEDFATVGLLKRLLPVLDELELAISSGSQGGKEGGEGLAEGVRMVYKKLESALRAEGLQPIEAVGKPFNPEMHEAMERVTGSDKDTDTVIGEIRRGYVFKDRVLRPSLVKVETARKVKGGGGETTDNTDEEEENRGISELR